MSINTAAICRVCLVKCKRRYTPLEDVMPLDTHRQLVTYAVAYTSCTQLDVRIGYDGLPDSICNSCTCDLRRAYDFRIKAKESFEKLSNQIDTERKDGGGIARIYELVDDINTDVDLLGVYNDEERTDSTDPLENNKNIDVVKKNVDPRNKFMKSTRFRPSDSIIDKPLNKLMDSPPDKNFVEDFDALDNIQNSTEFSGHSSFGDNDEIMLHKDSASNRMIDPMFSAEKELFSKGQKKCSICEQRYFTTIGLNAHMEVHQVKANHSAIRKPYKKPLRVRPDTEVLSIDLKSHNENNLHLATDFEKSAIDESEEIKVHKVGRKKSRGRKSKDPQSKIPKSKSPEFAHLKSEHSKSKQVWACDLCDKSYTSKHSLNHHMRTHTGERPFECKVCGDRFICKSTLKAHQRRHTGERPYGCDVCGKRFIQHSSMMTHMKLNHMAKTLQCPHCIKKYTRQLDFDRHILSHSGYKGFKCYLCPTEFVRQSNLENHLRNLHPNESDAANKANGSTNSANTENTKDRPFLCDLCPSRFTKQSMLSKHINYVHSKEPDLTKTEDANTDECT